MKKIVKKIIKILFCNIFYRVKYTGLENIKDIDKCLICPNHSNTVEPTWIYAVVDDLAIMAKAELFKNKIIAKILEYFNVFPIHRGEHDIRSLIHAISLFNNTNKRKLLIFPEGERLKKDVDRLPGKVGASYVAYKANVPMVPVYITKNAKLFSKVDVIFGKPIYLEKGIIKDKEKLQKFANDFMDRVYEMKNKK